MQLDRNVFIFQLIFGLAFLGTFADKANGKCKISNCNDGNPTIASAPSQRINDEQLKLPSNWQQCNKDSDCKQLFYGCFGMTAANKEFFEKATDLAHKIAGNPAAMSCVSTAEEAPVEVLCKENKCGAWKFSLCQDASCSKKYPKCRFTRKIYSLPKKDDSFGMSQELIQGILEDACIQSCKKKIREFKSEQKSDSQFYTAFSCTFDEKMVHSE
ncbi:MAG: hypothetical protein NTX25_03115 [Proteobacteria bacterium]|nr:hypothetical protein [Pseudomonadota bacterium]